LSTKLLEGEIGALVVSKAGIHCSCSLCTDEVHVFVKVNSIYNKAPLLLMECYI